LVKLLHKSCRKNKFNFSCKINIPVKDSKSITETDMNKLRTLGWQDSEILEATFHGTSQVASDMVFNAFKIENDKM